MAHPLPEHVKRYGLWRRLPTTRKPWEGWTGEGFPSPIPRSLSKLVPGIDLHRKGTHQIERIGQRFHDARTGNEQVLHNYFDAAEAQPKGAHVLTEYDPSPESVFDAVIPEYLYGVLYGAVVESYCSEQSARRMAMEAASDNAGEMIENLNLSYNRARQAAITQEITEIVAGSGEVGA